MEEIKFWQRWSYSYRYLYIFLLSLFFLSVAYFITGWVLGIDAVINWTHDSEFKTFTTGIDTFIHNLIQYSVDVNTYLIEQTYGATGILINPASSYIFLAFVLAAFIFFVTVITYLDIFWFGLGMAFFLVFLVTLKTELLGIFNQENRYFLIGLILITILTTYYFHSFNKNVRFLPRLLVIAAVVLISGVIIALASNTTAPFLLLANFSIPIPFFLTFLFMVLIGHDIVYGFLYLVTSGKSTKPGTRSINFLLISGLYIFNLIALLLEKMDYVEWDILLINPFIIYLISTVVGLYVYRQKLKGSHIIGFHPYGAIFYLSLAIVSTASIGFGFITGNDPLIEMFEYMIVYTHLAFGIVFVCYVLINFLDLFKKNVPIYKIAFKPRRMPYFIVQGLSLLIILALFLNANRYPYHLGVSGYSNLAGDVYNYQKDYLLANEYYKEGFTYAYRNHRSNYSLGAIALKQDKPAVAQEYFTQALVRNPSPYAFVQLSNLYKESEMFFPALFMLKDGIERFPESGPITNNLGLAYAKANRIDSAYFFLEQAVEFTDQKEIPAANMLAFLVNHGLSSEADSLSDNWSYERNLPYQNNLLVVKNQVNEPYNKEFLAEPYKDSVINGNEFPYLYNLGLSKVRSDDTLISKKIDLLADLPENQLIGDYLELIDALKKWYTGDKFEAVKQLDVIKLGKLETSPYFSKIVGMLLFKQKAYANAAFYLKDAHQEQDQEALLYYAVALTETRTDHEQVLNILNLLSESELADIKEIANNLRLVLTTNNISEIKEWDAPLKYQYLHFRQQSLSEAQMLEIYQSIDNPSIKLLTNAELMEYYLQNGQLIKAREMFEQVNLPENQNNYYAGEFNIQYLNLLTKEEKWQQLQEAVNKRYLNDYSRNNIPYFKARINEAEGDTALAKQLYKKAIQANPFNEDVYVAAADFFLATGNTNFAYNVLVNGLELQPESIALHKSYIKLARAENLTSFAEDAMKRLSNLLPKEKYQEFINELESN